MKDKMDTLITPPQDMVVPTKRSLFSSLYKAGSNCYWHSVIDVQTYDLVMI